MIEYCLDTNVCIAIINGSSVPVRARLKAVLAEGSVVCVSSVVLHELWYGVAKSAQQRSNTERVRAFLSGPFEILPWDDEDARAAGEVRACHFALCIRLRVIDHRSRRGGHSYEAESEAVRVLRSSRFRAAFVHDLRAG